MMNIQSACKFLSAILRNTSFETNKFLTFSNLNDSSHSDGRYIAQYESADEANQIACTYLKLFRFLQLEKKIEIVIFNSQHQEIGTQEIKQ